MYYYEENTEPLDTYEKTKKNKGLILVLIFLGILIIAGGAYAFIYFQNSAALNKLLTEGVELLTENKGQEALLTYEKVLTIEPANVQGMAGKGLAYVSVGDYEKGEKLIKTAMVNIESEDEVKEIFSTYLNVKEFVKIPDERLIAINQVFEKQGIQVAQENSKKTTTGNIPKDDSKKEDIKMETKQTTIAEKKHVYEFICEDITWEEASQKCKNKGGYLVNINSDAEWNYILGEISKLGYDNRKFYIGGKRDSSSNDYYWINQSGQKIGSSINNEKYWLEGEPTFRDDTLGVDEKYMMMYFYDRGSTWNWVDVMNNVPGEVDAYRGKIAYICEKEV